jgi:hypothetical protein
LAAAVLLLLLQEYYYCKFLQTLFMSNFLLCRRPDDTTWDITVVTTHTEKFTKLDIYNMANIAKWTKMHFGLLLLLILASQYWSKVRPFVKTSFVK